MRTIAIATMSLLFASCQQRSADSDRRADTEVAEASTPGAPDGNVVAQAPDGRPLAEPDGPIDPKSSEAAGQVVQRYGALIEQGKFAQARESWSDPSAAEGFEAQLKSYREIHLTIGELGVQEGAAGSIFITEPVTFYGKSRSGADFSRGATVTLRRVNDVPGSSEAERRWHIHSIDWS